MVSRKMAHERCMQKFMNSLDKYGRIDGINTLTDTWQVLFTGMIRQV